MSQSIRFVFAGESDAIAIIRLRKEIWGTTYRGIYPDSMIDDFDCEWHLEKELQRIRSSDYEVYLIMKHDFALGYLTIRKTDVMTLQSLYILREYQGQGIGRTAFAFLKEYCIKNTLPAFFCHCVPENWPARRFYDRMGGIVIGEDLDNEENWMNSVFYRFDMED